MNGKVRHPFVVVDREKLKVHRFDSAKDVAAFFWGRRIDRFLVIKDESKLVPLTSPEASQIEATLKAA